MYTAVKKPDVPCLSAKLNCSAAVSQTISHQKFMPTMWKQRHGIMSAAKIQSEQGLPRLMALGAAPSVSARGRAGRALGLRALGLRGAASGILGLNHMLPTLQITSGSLRGPTLHH